MTTKTLIKEGKLVDLGWLKDKETFGYLADDGRTILRVEVGSRTKWQIEGEDFLYRDLWSAYKRNKF